MKPTRETILSTAFCDILQKVGPLTLRPLSAASFTLLGRLKNPMMVGTAGDETTQGEMFDAVIQYLWIHSAPLAQVAAIRTAEDLPAGEILELGFSIPMGHALAFLESYKACSQRMSLSLAEVEDEDGPGKQATTAPAPAGSPPSSSPSVPPVIPGANDIYFGGCPSNAHLPISMPPIPPTEPAAAGLVLPMLTTMESMPPAPPSPLSN
jgi:hypothetical protein